MIENWFPHFNEDWQWRWIASQFRWREKDRRFLKSLKCAQQGSPPGAKRPTLCRGVPQEGGYAVYRTNFPLNVTIYSAKVDQTEHGATVCWCASFRTRPKDRAFYSSQHSPPACVCVLRGKKQNKKGRKADKEKRAARGSFPTK